MAISIPRLSFIHALKLVYVRLERKCERIICKKKCSAVSRAQHTPLSSPWIIIIMCGGVWFVCERVLSQLMQLELYFV